MGHIAHQVDLAGLVRGERIGLGDAGVVDNGSGQFIGCLCGEINMTACGADGSALVDQSFKRAFLDFNFYRPAEV